MSDESPIALINDAVMRCVEYGRIPVRAFVGADAMALILDHLGVFAKWESIGLLYMHTAGGCITVTIRPRLYQSVIIEDSTGEPWIAP